MTTMAEPATTDLNQLEAFHALLPALAGALDVRDVTVLHRHRAYHTGNPAISLTNGVGAFKIR
jgi:hypothetical protein